MGGITDPAEEYFKDGLWAWDPAGTEWLKLIIDPLTNHLMVDPGDDFEVHQTTPADMLTGLCTWDGTVWRRNALIWGYSDRYMEFIWDDDVAAGTAALTFTQVPPGEVWVVTQWSAYAAQDNPSIIRFYVYDGANNRLVYACAYPTAELTVQCPNEVILKADDRLYITFADCLLNDDVRGAANGYKMKVAE